MFIFSHSTSSGSGSGVTGLPASYGHMHPFPLCGLSHTKAHAYLHPGYFPYTLKTLAIGSQSSLHLTDTTILGGLCSQSVPYPEPSPLTSSPKTFLSTPISHTFNGQNLFLTPGTQTSYSLIIISHPGPFIQLLARLPQPQIHSLFHFSLPALLASCLSLSIQLDLLVPSPLIQLFEITTVFLNPKLDESNSHFLNRSHSGVKDTA